MCSFNGVYNVYSDNIPQNSKLLAKIEKIKTQFSDILSTMSTTTKP